MSRSGFLIVIVLLAIVTYGVVHWAAGSTRGAPAHPPAFDVGRIKRLPLSPGFEGCPPTGDGGDTALNRRKNRVDSSMKFDPVLLTSMLDLPVPAGIERRPRASWTGMTASAVRETEGLPVSVDGFVAAARQEGPEATNCHGADPVFRDWHIWLVDTPGGERARAVVVEATPPVRARHPGWTLEKIRRLARDQVPVRISGWLLLDQEHPDQLGRTRGTLWEVHPIMAIEVQRGGRWMPLDDID